MTVRTFLMSAKKPRTFETDFSAACAIVSLRDDQYDEVYEAVMQEAKERWPEADGWMNHSIKDNGELKRGYLLGLASSAND